LYPMFSLYFTMHDQRGPRVYLIQREFQGFVLHDSSSVGVVYACIHGWPCGCLYSVFLKTFTVKTCVFLFCNLRTLQIKVFLLFITGIAHGTNALAESPDYTWKQRKQQLVRLTAHSAACWCCDSRYHSFQYHRSSFSRPFHQQCSTQRITIIKQPQQTHS
jgi:hypothetical protein